jgi:hypothetical protein
VSKVRLGEHNLGESNPNRREYGVLRTIKHNEYKSRPSLVNDIGLIELSERVIFTKYIYPLCLNIERQGFEEKIVTTTGFGSTSHEGDSSKILQKVRLQIKSNDLCTKHFNINDSQMCIKGEMATNNNFKDTCYGNCFLFQIYCY